MNLIRIIIGIVVIVVALYNFDWRSFNQIFFPIMLIMTALSIIIGEPESTLARKWKNFLSSASAALAVFLILKMLFYD